MPSTWPRRALWTGPEEEIAVLEALFRAQRPRHLLASAIATGERALSLRSQRFGPDRPEHPHLPQQPRPRLQLCRRPRPRPHPLQHQLHRQRARLSGPTTPTPSPAVSNLAGAYHSIGPTRTRHRPFASDPRRQRTRPRTRPPRHPHHPQQPRRRLPVRQASSTAPSPSYEATLADSERVLGPDHPDTLTSRNNLAYAYRVRWPTRPRHHPPRSRPLTDSETCPRTRPPRHPHHPQQPRRAYQSAGQLERGHPPLRTHPRRPANGSSAPTTPTPSPPATTSLAPTESAGQLDRAITLLRAHPRRQRTHPRARPPQHPHHPQQPRQRIPVRRPNRTRHPPPRRQTLADQRTPARTRPPRHPHQPQQPRQPLTSPQAKSTAPSPSSRQHLADSERTLGPDHPNTLTSRNNLAGAYQASGQLERAIPLFEATVNDSERTLGPDHPDTLNGRNNLATALWDVGRWEEARVELAVALEQARKVLSADHHVRRLIESNVEATRQN